MKRLFESICLSFVLFGVLFAGNPEVFAGGDHDKKVDHLFEKFDENDDGELDKGEFDDLSDYVRDKMKKKFKKWRKHHKREDGHDWKNKWKKHHDRDDDDHYRIKLKHKLHKLKKKAKYHKKKYKKYKHKYKYKKYKMKLKKLKHDDHHSGCHGKKDKTCEYKKHSKSHGKSRENASSQNENYRSKKSGTSYSAYPVF